MPGLRGCGGYPFMGGFVGGGVLDAPECLRQPHTARALPAIASLGHLPCEGRLFSRAQPAHKGAPLCGELAEPARPEGL